MVITRYINGFTCRRLLFHVRVALVVPPLRPSAGRTGLSSSRPPPLTPDNTSRSPRRRPSPEEGEEGEAYKRSASLLRTHLRLPSHRPNRLSSSSALPLQSPYTRSASKSSSFPRSPVMIDPFRHSTPRPITSTPISSAPIQIDQKHQPPPATPRLALSLLLHPHPPRVQVVA